MSTHASPEALPADLSHFFPLLEAADRLPRGPGGKKLSKAILYRWANAQKLKTIRIGDRLFTCQQWVDEFTGRKPADPVKERRDRANREADALGI